MQLNKLRTDFDKYTKKKNMKLLKFQPLIKEKKYQNKHYRVDVNYSIKNPITQGSLSQINLEKSLISKQVPLNLTTKENPKTTINPNPSSQIE